MTNEQYVSRPYITLDWADVEAWVKSNPRTNTNRRGGYYTECPVPTHKTDDFISVWDGDDHIGLKCFGDCTYRDMLEAIAKSIKTSALDWADVEAWVKSNPRTTTNRRSGYYTECPVPTHKTDDSISVWDGDDHIGLKCFGDCTYWDVLEAIAKATKTSAAPDTESPTAAEARIKELEQEVAAAQEQAREGEQELAATQKRASQLESLVEDLRGGTLKARKEERDKAESQISGLRQDLKNAQTQQKRSQEKLRADNETLQKQLAAATPEVMNDAWRHIHNEEPLAAYREAMAILESKLRDVLGNPRKPTSSQELDLYPLMEMAATRGHINGKQLDHLDLMRERRNSFAHNSEEKVRKSKNPLTESEARAAVAYLGQVIDQL